MSCEEHFQCGISCKAEDELRAEVAIARERLGPAGYKILEEVLTLRAECKKLQGRKDAQGIHTCHENCQNLLCDLSRRLALAEKVVELSRAYLDAHDWEFEEAFKAYDDAKGKT